MVPLPLAASMAAISVAFCSNTCDGAVEVGGIGIEVSDGLNNSSGGAIDFSQSRTVDGAVAVGGLDGSDISSCSTSGEGGVEVGGIGVEISERLNNSGGGAIDFSQAEPVDGAIAVGGLDGGDIRWRFATPVRVELKLVGSESRSVMA